MNTSTVPSTAPIGAVTEDANLGQQDLDLAIWPRLNAAIAADEALEQRLERILAAMTLPQKIGQIVQADISAVTADDVKQYQLGSVLNGGNSAPNADLLAGPKAWLDLVDSFWMPPNVPDQDGQLDGDIAIPIIYGTDAVHGHSNIAGATIFPHNVSLGAANDPELMRRIGTATALEVRTTGMEWAFAPTIAVATDVRWGRAYESYSCDPARVSQLGTALIEGLQGQLDSADFLGPNKVAACAKHFLGDGGVRDGRDQGDTDATEAQLRDIHALPYLSVLPAGLTSVMASFSSWGGRKIHGRRDLLTDLLRTHWGFDGMLVGDWNAHGQLDGATPENAPSAINAGLDLYMAPDSWRGLYHNLLAQAQDGTISAARLDDAVRNILRLKLRLGLFDAPRPSARLLAGAFDHLASPAHLNLAAEAVVKSAVLLKNEGGALPIASNSHIMVCGRFADSLDAPCGGWTLSWQGGEKLRAAYPYAQTLYQGILASASQRQCHVSLSVDGQFTQRPDVAVVAIGEDPYAEFRGDRDTLDYRPGDDSDYALIRSLRAQGIKVITIFYSGRPLWVNPALNNSDAFVAAFLPGTMAGAMAELLFDDGPDFSGTLPFPWPEYPDDSHLCHPGKAGRPPLFALGYGLTRAQASHLRPLGEQGLATGQDPKMLFARGVPQSGWTLALVDGGGQQLVETGACASPNSALTSAPADYGQQENARAFHFSADGSIRLRHAPIDLSRDANADIGITLDARIDQGGTLTITVWADGQSISLPLTVATGTALDAGIQLRSYRKRGLNVGAIDGIDISASTGVRLVLRTLSIKAMVAGTGEI